MQETQISLLLLLLLLLLMMLLQQQRLRDDLIFAVAMLREQGVLSSTTSERPNDLHYSTFRREPMADPMDAHPWAPAAFHAVARGRPRHPTGWSMGIHGRACGIPWAPT